MTMTITPQYRTPSENMLWRLQDVARYLNISRSFAYHLVETGQLPCVRLGKAVRVRPCDLQAYIEQNLHSQSDDR